ncbi:MAG: imidazole glycerol phosphate synthase subunit HisH [Anaerolineaceae bacterium]|nr:imidazole glycerol phosphate synthase subunit HisH [Anaerolineaceae bacterium]
MKSKPIFLVDAGTGNIRSVAKALTSLGAQVRLVTSPQELEAGRVVLPGVGAFGQFVTGLSSRGLAEPLRACVARGDPLLGICVGMQAFFESSEEFGGFDGLGLLPGCVVRFIETPQGKVPHTGWNQLWPQNGGGALLKNLSAGAYAYFNHSYYCQAELRDTSAQTDYIQDFASMVQHGNLYGVQFHPEKSQRVGLKILTNFLELG